MENKNRLLLVEDDPLIGEDLKNTLSKFGYSVVGPIRSGEEVLQKIDSLDIDFALFDINLAGKLDGIETAEKLQRIKSVPVVFLSALNDEATLQRAKLAKPYGYLIKPFDPNELRSTIELTLHRFLSDHNPAESEKSTLKHQDTISFDQDLEQDSDAAIFGYLSKLKVFSGIPKTDIEELARVSIIKEINAGECLVSEGDESVDGIFIPLSGRISITKTSESGKELIVALLAPGDIFGFLYSLPEFAGNSSAKTKIDSKIIWIPISKWQYFSDRTPQVHKNLTNYLSERLSSAYTLSSSLAHARVEGRIISSLIALLPNFGKNTSKNNNDQRIFITRKELSELTGTTPETAIRVTKNLEREGLLDLARPGIIKIPDIKALKAVIG